MYVTNEGYWFKADGIRKIEERYGAKHMGYWCTRNPRGGWNERPVDVFYQPNPDKALGHSHYFGMFIQNDEVYITNAESAFAEGMTGALCADGEVIISRYVHDYIEKKGVMIDGGRDYVRSTTGKLVRVTVEGSEFVFEK
jgi:hypothetical protein